MTDGCHNDDDDNLFKAALMNGLLPALDKQFKMTCISWKTTSLQAVIEQCEHAERQQLSQQDKTKQRIEKGVKLQAAQLAFIKDRASSGRLRKDLKMMDRGEEVEDEEGEPVLTGGPDSSNNSTGTLFVITVEKDIFLESVETQVSREQQGVVGKPELYRTPSSPLP
jgi:hypothetical protein